MMKAYLDEIKFNLQLSTDNLFPTDVSKILFTKIDRPPNKKIS